MTKVSDFKGTIQWIVDRHHVSVPPSVVVRDMYRRLRHGCNEAADADAWRKFWTRSRRKEAYRIALKRHAANRQLYLDVTRGGRW